MDPMDLIECKLREMFVSGSFTEPLRSEYRRRGNQALAFTANNTHCLIHRMLRIQLNNYNTHLSLHHSECAIVKKFRAFDLQSRSAKGRLEIITVYDNHFSAGLFKKDVSVKTSFKISSRIITYDK
ncbi:hypothetical protein L873DRAFT_1810627 [Choiromyces venosus 120613-1]|uniref:Uncharacterized protein n=1 Tax=Choiromyces venosus 120613-1 TaxID=1336337 RepID=A0A3N4JF46_9PEZI|nr:hypothetical protein L873DRAFT_1810627 [Choiromyces venosus 120613-1]